MYNKEETVYIEHFGNTTQVVLNNGAKCNSVGFSMTQRLLAAMEHCERNVNTKTIIFRGSDSSVFCAGGDIKELAQAFHADVVKIADFYIAVYDYYRLIYLLGTMQTSLISVADGLTYGSATSHVYLAKFGIATENTRISISEAGVGHFCDAGLSYVLSRLEGHLGVYLAMTGHVIQAEDAVFAGILTHFVPSKNLPDVYAALASTQDQSVETIDSIITQYATDDNHIPKHYTLHGEKLKIINRCFQYDRVEDIVFTLKMEKSDFAKDCLSCIAGRSPTSLKIMLMLIRDARNRSLGECLEAEYPFWRNFHLRKDFKEGTAALFAKRKPQWNPATLEETSVEMIEAQHVMPISFPRFDEHFDLKANFCKLYTLPSRDEIKYVKRTFALKNKQEVIDWFKAGKRGAIFGLEQKINDCFQQEKTIHFMHDLSGKL